MRSAGAFYSSRRSLLSYRPQIFEKGKSTTPVMITLKRWCKENFFSVSQGRRLIARKQLLAKKYKNTWYVYPCEEFDRDF